MKKKYYNKGFLFIIALIVMSVALVGCTSNSNNDSPLNTQVMNDMMEQGNTGSMMKNIESEREFVVEMIPHHQEAVDTSKIIVANTNNEELRQLAQDIISAQEKEIKMMSEWVETDYEGKFDAEYQDMMPDLESLSGTEQDDAYLMGMIMHHKMAVIMAENVLRLLPSSKVADFAESVIEVQTEEIAIMQDLITDKNRMPMNTMMVN